MTLKMPPPKALAAASLTLMLMLPAPAAASTGTTSMPMSSLAAATATAPVSPSVTAEPSPVTAAFISALGPLGVAAGSGLLYQAGLRDTTPLLCAAILGPLALGAGHAYAGDPVRGLGVGVGTYYAASGGLLLGAGLWLLLGEKTLESLITVPLVTASVVVLGYYGWAIADAAHTAERAAGR